MRWKMYVFFLLAAAWLGNTFSGGPYSKRQVKSSYEMSDLIIKEKELVMSNLISLYSMFPSLYLVMLMITG